MSGDIAGLYGGQGVETGRSDAPTGDFTPLPPGWYPVEIEKAEIRDNKAKDGKYLWLEMTVIGEHYSGRKLFPKINLLNKNPKAEEIGQRDLDALGQACGIAVIKDSQEFLGQQLDVRLKIEAAKGDFDADNKVTAYARLGSKSADQSAPRKARQADAPAQAWNNKPAPAAEQPQPAAAAPAKAPGKRPWEN